MADVNEATLATFTPVLTDYLRGIDAPAGAHASGNVEITALRDLLQETLDLRYLRAANIAYTTANFSKTSDTTVANVTGLSHTLVAGGVYQMRANLYMSCNASGGAKAGFAGTCTATSVVFTGFFSASTGGLVIGGGLRTTLDNALGSTTALTNAILMGTITVANAGTLTVQFAQNASYGTASIVLPGSTFECYRIG